ncbi:S1 family peptidase [Hyella patelloides]|nr:serine protease [Hyella patelloides]
MLAKSLMHLGWKTYVSRLLWGLGLSLFAINPALAELSLEEINSIARQTTVLIAPGLTPEFIEELEANRSNPLASQSNPDGVWNPGSGVIIGRNQNTYYVLTVTHNFKQRYLESNIPHGIRTSDGKVYAISQVNDGRDCPLKDDISDRTLIRFGCYSVSIPTRVDGTDLAVISFESKSEYPIASLGSPENLGIGDRVYLSGWPDPEKIKDPTTGRCKGRVARRQRRLAWTPVTRKIAAETSEHGYNLFYFDLTRPGMSGGPVFDNNGFVIGVHGRGSADKGNLIREYCSLDLAQGNKLALESGDFESNDLERVVQAAVNYAPPLLYSQFSSGQSSNNFLSLWTNLNIDLLFNRQAPTREFINSALTAIAETDTSSGTLDVAVTDDITGSIDLQTEQDVVEDIYQGFTLKNLIRDEPSPGCEFLLLGDSCE